ncbi:MAG: zinc ABC transporter substrate-binding protein [Nitrospirota bacterium]
MKNIMSAFLVILLCAQSGFAEVKAVATLPWIESIVKEVGKDKVSVTALVKPAQDPHALEARPGMVLAVRKADLLVYNGLDLEAGYLPALVESSRNPKIQPGQTGNLDCSRFVSVIEAGGRLDRSMGDVHPFGNPHYHFSPGNIARVAQGIAAALSRLDPPNSSFYNANLRAFTATLREREKQWHAKPLKGKQFIAYHKLFEYLAAEFGFTIAGYIEQKPGIPPSSGHMHRLIETITRIKPAGILTTTVYGGKETSFVHEKTGLKVIELPHDVGASDKAKDWFGMMDTVVSMLE